MVWPKVMLYKSAQLKQNIKLRKQSILEWLLKTFDVVDLQILEKMKFIKLIIS